MEEPVQPWTVVTFATAATVLIAGSIWAVNHPRRPHERVRGRRLAVLTSMSAASVLMISSLTASLISI